MAYLEYDLITKQVVEIHETEPSVIADGYAIAYATDYAVGDEFTNTIWVNQVNSDGIVELHSAIRNNPNSKRLLEENNQLKQDTADLNLQIIELWEILIDGGVI